MVESDFRNSATRHHHRRRRGSKSRVVESGDVNSHIPESAPRGAEHNHHGEKNPRKERVNKMTKRTTKILSALAVMLMFGFTLSAKAASFVSVDQRSIDAGVDIRQEAFRPDIRADFKSDFLQTEIRFDGRDVRSDWRTIRIDGNDISRLKTLGDSRLDGSLDKSFVYAIGQRTADCSFYGNKLGSRYDRPGDKFRVGLREYRSGVIRDRSQFIASFRVDGDGNSADEDLGGRFSRIF